MKINETISEKITLKSEFKFVSIKISWNLINEFVIEIYND
jgi:hypothetical protein